MAYETKQAILEEAGLINRVDTPEALDGLVDGSNKVFTTSYKPLVDTNNDGSVDEQDVTAYVDGSEVSVSQVDAETGEITFVAAPAADAVVTLVYSYTNVADSYVTKIREETEDWINTEMNGTDPVPYTTVPKTIRKVARYYAAGLLLLKEYGDRSDNEELAKNGNEKIKKAERWLTRYIEIGGSTGLTSDDFDVVVESDPSIFDSYDRENSRYPYGVSDDLFMRDTYGGDL